MTYNQYLQFTVIEEGVGKSQLISRLQESMQKVVILEVLFQKNRTTKIDSFIDTPGIVFDSDSETTKIAISSMEENDAMLLVARATNIDDDLEYFLPLIKNKRGVVIVTNWDRVNSKMLQAYLKN